MWPIKKSYKNLGIYIVILLYTIYNVICYNIFHWLKNTKKKYDSKLIKLNQFYIPTSFILPITCFLSVVLMIFFIHIVFSCFQRGQNFQVVVMEHLKMNDACWGWTIMVLLGKFHTVIVDEVLSWLMNS